MDYRDWIGWIVPIWLVAALGLALRRAPMLGLSIVGAFAGFVLISIAPPLGRNAEEFGSNVAVGLIGGAVAGALIAAAFGSDAPAIVTRRRGRSMMVVGVAVASGVAGAVILGFGLALLREVPPDLDLVTFRAALAGGGIGWVAGALVGWRVTRDSRPTRPSERRVLLSAALPIAILGVSLASSVRDAAFGPMIDDVWRHDPLLGSLEAWVWLDTAIGILTVVVVALRRTSNEAPREIATTA